MQEVKLTLLTKEQRLNANLCAIPICLLLSLGVT
ncbi:hypothetical protein T4D_6436 [Trichinella pseudospiralis]|uniref:Uncharacterized protein n=1 Tax=Trichinella pseudospiralis TaxID=6337 RepID=A0A0V1E5K1_TRIPS|nr:hypothetical protein T4D_6436 [Trichinella pseudospiralis]